MPAFLNVMLRFGGICWNFLMTIYIQFTSTFSELADYSVNGINVSNPLTPDVWSIKPLGLPQLAVDWLSQYIPNFGDIALYEVILFAVAVSFVVVAFAQLIGNLIGG